MKKDKGLTGAPKKRSKVKRVIRAVATVTMVLGIVAVCLPFASEQVHKSAWTEENGEAVAAQGAETDKLAELRALLESRNARYAMTPESNITCEEDYADDDIDLASYGLEQIGWVRIPKIDQTLPIVLGASQDKLALGAGHLTGTSYPIGGESTNCMLSGHRGWYWSDMFRNLDYLEPGDLVHIDNPWETLTYRVVSVTAHTPGDTTVSWIQEGKDLLTLSTCHPKWQTPRTQRLVAVCERVE